MDWDCWNISGHQKGFFGLLWNGDECSVLVGGPYLILIENGPTRSSRFTSYWTGPLHYYPISHTNGTMTFLPNDERDIRTNNQHSTNQAIVSSIVPHFCLFFLRETKVSVEFLQNKTWWFGRIPQVLRPIHSIHTLNSVLSPLESSIRRLSKTDINPSEFCRSLNNRKKFFCCITFVPASIMNISYTPLRS